MSKVGARSWKLHIVCVLISISLLSEWILSTEATSSAEIGQYEEFCTDDDSCHKSAGLTCQNQRCKCAPGGETVFSISKNRCVGAAGRECLREGNETLCVENSVCRDYNYMYLCACKDSFYQSRNGNCYKIAKYGESCREEDYACGDSVTSSISCVERKCRCLLGEENQYFDEGEGRCVSYAGSQCLYHYPSPCSDNSYCGEIAENINGASFVVGHRCLCKIGYSYSRSRRCLARFGYSCNSENPCNHDDFLGCLNGICQCRNPLNEILDEKAGHCALYVGSTCKSDSGPKCVQNAECVASPQRPNSTGSSRSQSKCECSKGFSVTPMNTCLLDFNQKCKPGECNHFNSLVCTNETCACVDSSLSYDKSTKMCVAMIGQPCGQIQVLDKSIIGEINEQKEMVVLCEGNASCVKSNSHSVSSGSNGAFIKRVCRSGSSSSKN